MLQRRRQFKEKGDHPKTNHVEKKNNPLAKLLQEREKRLHCKHKSLEANRT